MFKRLKFKTTKSKELEEKLYETALEQFENGEIRRGMWAKALANTAGDEKRALALYLKNSVQSMKDEMEQERLDTSAASAKALEITQNKEKLARRKKKDEEAAEHERIKRLKEICRRTGAKYID